MEFHQTLQTHSYLQKKKKLKLIKSLELGANATGIRVISLVILNNSMAFVYAYFFL